MRAVSVGIPPASGARPRRRAPAAPVVAVLAVLLLLLLGACGSDQRTSPDSSTDSSAGPPDTVSHAGLDKIKHVVVIMQENRSFDSYFGTFPGPTGSR